jgi:hypothetical protein
MSFSNITQNPPLGQMNVEPLDQWYAEIENLTSEGIDSVNIPWLLSISLAIGNATTEAIGRNAVVFSEPEWGEIVGAGVGSMYGNGGIGSGEGGLYVSW